LFGQYIFTIDNSCLLLKLIFSLKGTSPTGGVKAHADGSKSNTAAEAVLGASYNLTKSIAVGAQYQHIFGGKLYSVDKQGAVTAFRPRFGDNAVVATVTYTF
jgi:opacity protein-like surface antigen